MSRALLENHAESKQLLKKNFLTCYSCSYYSSTIIVFSFLVKYWKLIYFFDKKETLIPTISFIIFWDFLMFYQLFLSPQVKWGAIITYKHGIYQLPLELPSDLRYTILDFGSNGPRLRLHPHGIIAAGGVLPTQEKKDLGT